MQTYHQLLALQKPAPAPPLLAHIHSISEGAARLTFADGATSQKYYRLPPGAALAVGQAVRLEKVCGTYVVAGAV